MTFQEIKDELSSYASTLSLSGVAIDKLCGLLAYSIYKNQMLQTRTLLESSFSTSINLNSRIHHAANLLYSVPRGRCPRISVSGLTSLKAEVGSATTYYSKLDEVMTYNGYYFYFAQDETTVIPNSLELIVSQNAKLSTTNSVTDTVYFVDFSADENVSLDYVIKTDSGAVLNCTENVNEFYDQELETESESYIYDALVVTIPNYGVRVIRRADDASWGTSSLTLTYIPYSETLPDISELMTFSGFTHSANWVNSTEVTSTEYVPRLTDLDLIYSRAIDSFCSKGQIATTADLLAALEAETTLEGAYYKVYRDTHFDTVTGDYSVAPSVTTVVASNCTSYQIDEMAQLAGEWSRKLQLPVSETIEFRLATGKGFMENSNVTYYVKVVSSSSKTITQSSLDTLVKSYLPMIGETLTHSRIEADIVRLGYDSVSLYDTSTGGAEVTPSIVCGKLEYPSPVLRVYTG